ncbi:MULTISPECIES: helix-turn-helix domain-containing protein [unclassified Streptomyces]|uniref:AraC-like ligand-binding domain-containing protein n=1 Tax=unclassified Streptomyces TaxID=2593676 RepID=UPI00278C64DD|nr:MULTISPECIES: helix-turn-helix domain-containing protein [unclassified Streptomyces]
MSETVFRGQDLPPAQRWEAWRQMAIASHETSEITTEHTADFDATLRVLGLGAVHVSTLTCPSLGSNRTSRLIRQSDPELYHLTFARRGSIAMDHADRQVVQGEGVLTLSTTSRPYRAQVAPGRDGVANRFTLVQALLPRALLPVPADAADRLLGVPLPAHDGPGALFAQCVDRLAADTTSYAPAQAARLGGVILGLAASLLGHHLDTDHVPSADSRTRRDTLTVRVHAFIEQHLGDPGLGPDLIAAAHHISVRSLHRLFQGQGTTVGAVVRRHRLERARQDLADPALNTRPVHAIAARCGFPRPADFTRSFRTAYGLPPRDYRRLAQGHGPGTPR